MKKFIGDKQFYKYVFALVIPIIIQQGITSFVNMIDNIMVGALGTEAISAVSISNQIFFIFNLAIFGGVGAMSIFSAQFFGKGDMEGVRFSFRAKIIFSVLIGVAAIIVMKIFGGHFISLFLQGDANGGDIALTYDYAIRYFTVMLFALIPFAIGQSYAMTLRETNQTFIPMVASITAILVNLVFNWILIYGNLGAPRLGVFGAAIATCMARYVEVLVLIIYSHTHIKRHAYFAGVYKSLYVPLSLVKRIITTGSPLLINELLWSFGLTATNQSYSTLGLDVVAATNIAITAWDIFSISMIAMGSAVQIIVGQQLGQGNIEKAKETDYKLIGLTIVLNIIVGALLCAVSPFVPLLYNVGESVRHVATSLLLIDGMALPILAYVHVIYFTIRSGGRTVITMLFDSVYTWVVPVPLAFCLSHYTNLTIFWIFFIVQFSEIIKVIIGTVMLRSGMWARKIV